jgi:hypothetical protein
VATDTYFDQLFQNTDRYGQEFRLLVKIANKLKSYLIDNFYCEYLFHLHICNPFLESFELFEWQPTHVLISIFRILTDMDKNSDFLWKLRINNQVKNKDIFNCKHLFHLVICNPFLESFDSFEWQPTHASISIFRILTDMDTNSDFLWKLRINNQVKNIDIFNCKHLFHLVICNQFLESFDSFEWQPTHASISIFRILTDMNINSDFLWKLRIYYQVKK